MSAPDSEAIGERQGARVCAGLFLAALVPAVAVAALGESLIFLPYALVVTGIHTLLLGLPAFVLAYEKGWVNALTCIGVAFVIGATPMGFSLWPEPAISPQLMEGLHGRGRFLRRHGRARRPDILVRAAHQRRAAAQSCRLMAMTALPAPLARLLDFLGDLGPRWGLPEAPCRVHGYLYLHAKAVPEGALRQALVLDAAALRDALAWLADYRLIERTPAGGARRTIRGT